MEAFSALRRAKNVCYPLAIQALGSSSSKAETAPKESDPSKDVPAKTLPSPIIAPKEVQQADTAEKEKEMAKEVALEDTKPPAVPKDSLKEKKGLPRAEW